MVKYMSSQMFLGYDAWKSQYYDLVLVLHIFPECVQTNVLQKIEKDLFCAENILTQQGK